MIDTLLQSWLDMQCNMTPGAVAGMAALRVDKAPTLVPVARWPEGGGAGANLLSAANMAYEKRAPQVQAMENQDAKYGKYAVLVSHPLIARGQVVGAASLLLEPDTVAGTDSALASLRKSIGWLEGLLGYEEAKQQAVLTLITSLVVTALSQQDFKAATTAIATELATVLKCDRASFGFYGRGHVQVVAISHSADFNQQQNLIRDIGAAMDEAVDQSTSIIYPPPDIAPSWITAAHADLASHHKSIQICTVPVTSPGKIIGAIVLERRSGLPFDGDTVALCVHLACLLAPILQLKHDNDLPVVEHIRDRFRDVLASLASKGYSRAKVIVWGGILSFVVLMLPFAHYRVSAPARLEGEVQRALVAPGDGFIKQVHVRPGDYVKTGQLLAELAGEDIALERRKLESELAQADGAYGAALVTRDRAQMAISIAHMEEVRAKLALIQQQLSRIQLKAPFNGVLIKGDLTQSLGAPVKQGEVLMMLAPREDFRVILEVDDRDIGYVKVGQTGQLALSALPGSAMDFHIKRITPVANAMEGRNFFEVEAKLDKRTDNLRPGLEGVGKVDIGRRSLAWTWFHRPLEWVRFKMWYWLA